MTDKGFRTDGVHVIADFYSVKKDKILNDEKKLLKYVKKAVEVSNAELIKVHSHVFRPQGITISGIISESSIDIHTYPEYKYMSVSFYTCGDKANPKLGIKYLVDKLRPSKVNSVVIKRGEIGGITTERPRR